MPEIHNTETAGTDTERDAKRRGVVPTTPAQGRLKRTKDDPRHGDDVRMVCEFTLATGHTPDQVRKAAWRLLGEVDDASEVDVMRAQGVVDGDRSQRDAQRISANQID